MTSQRYRIRESLVGPGENLIGQFEGHLAGDRAWACVHGDLRTTASSRRRTTSPDLQQIDEGRGKYIRLLALWDRRGLSRLCPAISSALALHERKRDSLTFVSILFGLKIRQLENFSHPLTDDHAGRPRVPGRDRWHDRTIGDAQLFHSMDS